MNRHPDRVAASGSKGAPQVIVGPTVPSGPLSHGSSSTVLYDSKTGATEATGTLRQSVAFEKQKFFELRLGMEIAPIN
jgi:hypothetical protein